MTREEAIKELQKGMPTFDSTDEECERYVEAYNMAIKALEQEFILDKIKAEIEDTGAYEQEVSGKTEFMKGITYCLNIIDKHKAESEQKGE